MRPRISLRAPIVISPVMDKPTILDLFCGAGGAARGYADAGFRVIGVDLNPQPRYPFEFIQHDAIELLRDIADYGAQHVLADACGSVAAIHASPPCQRWSAMSNCRPGLAGKYPALIEPARELLRCIGLPYVIENVPGSPLIDPAVLCGSQFYRVAEWPGRGRFGLRRHRLFETSFPVPSAGWHNHSLPSVAVYGDGAPGNRPDLKGKGFEQLRRDVMGIDWMTRAELNEAIPPAYTHYIGTQLLSQLSACAGKALRTTGDCSAIDQETRLAA